MRLIAADDKDAGGGLLRWRLALQEFNYTVIHRSGVKNANADALSRMYLESDDPFEEGPTSIDPTPALNFLMARDGGSAIVKKWGEREWNMYDELQDAGIKRRRARPCRRAIPPGHLQGFAAMLWKLNILTKSESMSKSYTSRPPPGLP